MFSSATALASVLRPLLPLLAMFRHQQFNGIPDGKFAGQLIQVRFGFCRDLAVDIDSCARSLAVTVGHASLSACGKSACYLRNRWVLKEPCPSERWPFRALAKKPGSLEEDQCKSEERRAALSSLP